MNCYCKNCGKLADVDDTAVLTSNPPRFNYSCPHCGYSGYIFCSDAFETPRQESAEEKILKKLEEISVELNNLRKDVDSVSKYMFSRADAAVSEAQKTIETIKNGHLPGKENTNKEEIRKTIETIKAGHLPHLRDLNSSKLPYGLQKIH